MKGSILAFGLLSLGAALFTPEVEASTYAGHGCDTRSLVLTKVRTGARNNNASAIAISCPLVRNSDGGTGTARSVIYFTNDGKSKSCFFDNYNIDTGGLGIWTGGSAVTRLALPPLVTTLRWQPLVLNCTLPAGSHVTGYALGE